jgi:hypothetical protein
MKRLTLRALFLICSVLFTDAVFAQNVGIGSSAFTPDSKSMLELRGDGYGILIPRMLWANRPTPVAAAQDGLMIYSTDGDGVNGKGYYYWDGSSWKKLFGGSMNDFIKNQTSLQSSANFNIDGNGYLGGNLGVGTTSPSTKVEIGGSAGLTLRNATTYSASGDDLSMINFGDAYGGNQARILIERGAAGSGGDNPTDISFWNTPDASVTLTERMRISNSGNVGIGTSSPGAKLEINGQVKITGGSPAAGKVLTSDATGLATWNTPACKVSSSLHPSMDDISGWTTLISSAVDDATYAINWGFNFTIDGTNYTTGWISTNGVLGFGTGTSTAYSNSSLPTTISNDPMLFFHWDDHYAKNIRYIVLGSAPSRVCFIEWDGYPRSEGDATATRIHVYIMLHEGSNVLMVRYLNQGSNQVAQGSSATFGFQFAGGGSARTISLGYLSKMLDDNNSNQHLTFSF